MKVRIAIIGGSGFYELLEEGKPLILDTPFGKSARIDVLKFGGKNIAFLPRHSKPGSLKVGHHVPPHKINYKANLYALWKLGVRAIIATNACGSLRRDIKPGDLLIPDQLVDMTKKREYTFYDGTWTPKKLIGVKVDRPVIHIDFTKPYCPTLRSIISKAAKELRIRIHQNGCYVCTEGPRFETPAEIKFFSLIGCDVVGMTGVPEAILARELNVCYASICVTTNYAAGMQERISQEEVTRIFNNTKRTLFKLLERTINMIPGDYSCECRKAVS